ncbi:MAG: YchF/TatD family DNA exonuclease, partial [Deltaproteobacteria bacterium]|nr:YchF/TatD family DNA exonuclease [Deltaproteobacteria bacterium]
MEGWTYHCTGRPASPLIDALSVSDDCSGMYVDSHCHLEAATYGAEWDEVIARACDAGLTHLVAVGASGVLACAREAVALAERLDAVYAAVGIHPHEAAKAQDADVAALAALLSEPKVVALGEIGLDYYYDHSPPEVQRALFKKLLVLGRERNLPVMLHVRDAHADTVALIDEVGLPERGGVVHCFTGGPAEAAAYLSRGMYLSIPGIVTFKNAAALREAVQSAPLARMLIETDSPYLAPVPHRGKRNEPAYVVHTALALGALKGLSGEDVGRITAQNAMRLFGLAEESKTALAYPIRNSLYVNLTSRCTLACVFCPKIEQRDWWVKGHWLRLQRDPPVEEVLAAVEAELARRPALEEVVFVGLGEPTLRLDAVLAVARALREKHGRRLRLRLDTDGLANLVHGRNVAPELAAAL